MTSSDSPSIQVIKLKYEPTSSKVDKTKPIDDIFLALFQDPKYQNLKTGWLKKPNYRNPANIISKIEPIEHNILIDEINKMMMSNKHNFKTINTIVSICENGFINSKMLNVHAALDQPIKSVLQKNLFVYLKIYFNDVIYLPNLSTIKINLINLDEDLLDKHVNDFTGPIIFTVMLNKNKNDGLKSITISPIQL